MTSIVTVSPARNLYEQVKWKCQVSSSIFSTIVFVHIILGLLMSDGTGSFSTGGSLISMEARTYTLDGAFIYSIILMLGIGWMLASQNLSHDHLSIVTNNKTEVLSTFFFMIILSIFTFLSGVCMLLITVALDMLKTNEQLLIENQFISFSTMLLFTLCMLLAGTIGYFTRVAFQYSKVIAVVIFVILILVIRTYGVDTWGVLFGKTTAEIILRSSLYVFVLWCLSFIMRLFREVSRS